MDGEGDSNRSNIRIEGGGRVRNDPNYEYDSWSSYLNRPTNHAATDLSKADYDRLIAATIESWATYRTAMNVSNAGAQAPRRPRMTFDSALGRRLRSAIANRDSVAINSVLDEVLARPPARSEALNIIQIESIVSTILPRLINSKVPQFADIIEQIDVINLSLAELSENVLKSRQEAKATFSEAQRLLLEVQEELPESLSRAEGEWRNLVDSRKQELELEGTSVFWKLRAISHGKKSKTLSRLSIVSGILSLALPIITAVIFFNSSKTLMGEALSDPLHELIFSSACTLLSLTLCLWATRVFVRLYMTERHLATDAESRAALGDTYLRLIAESGATPADRQIVLATLFRPVRDGIVQDDGMPLFSPAALASGALLGGKGIN